MAIEEGRHIAIRFSENLTGDVSGLTPTPAGYKKRAINLANATATALNQYSTSYPASYAIDGNTGNYWRGTTQVNWLAVQLPEAKVVTGLRLNLGSYYIKTFTFSGSNDGATWTQIGGTYTAANSTTQQWYEFEIENTTDYLHYRIDTVTTYSTSRVYVYELEMLENVPIGNEANFTVTVPMHDMVPGGTTHDVVVPVESVSQDASLGEDVLLLNFPSGNLECIRNAAGPITVAYEPGTLAGLGGPVEAFVQTFTATDLLPKNHPNDIEHIALYTQATGSLRRVTQNDTQEHEHIELVVLPVGVLTHVDDI